jgi:hypothetical protein
MPGGKPRAQRPDAAGTDDRDPELLAFDDLLLSEPEQQLTADERR